MVKSSFASALFYLFFGFAPKGGETKSNERPRRMPEQHWRFSLPEPSLEGTRPPRAPSA